MMMMMLTQVPLEVFEISTLFLRVEESRLHIGKELMGGIYGFRLLEVLWGSKCTTH